MSPASAPSPSADRALRSHEPFPPGVCGGVSRGRSRSLEALSGSSEDRGCPACPRALASPGWEEQTEAGPRANLAAAVVLPPPESAWQSHLLPFIRSPRLPGLHHTRLTHRFPKGACSPHGIFRLPARAPQRGASPGKRGARGLLTQSGFGVGFAAPLGCPLGLGQQPCPSRGFVSSRASRRGRQLNEAPRNASPPQP